MFRSFVAAVVLAGMVLFSQTVGWAQSGPSQDRNGGLPECLTREQLDSLMTQLRMRVLGTALLASGSNLVPLFFIGRKEQGFVAWAYTGGKFCRLFGGYGFRVGTDFDAPGRNS